MVFQPSWGGSLNWDDDKPNYNWDQIHYELKDKCKGLNDELKSTDKPIKCEMDEPSFQKHLEAQLKIKVHNNRDSGAPDFYCGSAVFSAFDGSYVGESGPGSDICPTCTCKKVLPEFLKSVHTIKCAYLEGKKKDDVPKVSLKGGVLLFEVFDSGTLSRGPFSEWKTQLRKIFPKYDECLVAHSQ
jgi:hypothetical protein